MITITKREALGNNCNACFQMKPKHKYTYKLFLEPQHGSGLVTSLCPKCIKELKLKLKGVK